MYPACCPENEEMKARVRTYPFGYQTCSQYVAHILGTPPPVYDMVDGENMNKQEEHNASVPRPSVRLHIAAHRGHIGTIEALMESGHGDVNEVDGRGMSALHWAACGGQSVCAVKLVEMGADLTAECRGWGERYACYVRVCVCMCVCLYVCM